MIPLQINFLDLDESDAVRAVVERRIEKLEHFYNKIIRAEVNISSPHRHRHSDRLYHVLIHLVLPNNDIIVNKHSDKNEAHRDIYVAVRDAFDAAERMLQDHIQILRHNVKTHNLTV